MQAAPSSQGEVPSGIYILRSGEAALIMKSAAGRAVMCATVGPGSVLDLPAVIGKQPYSLSLMVKKGSHVAFITERDFESVLRAEPSLYPKILEVLASETRFARQALARSETNRAERPRREAAFLQVKPMPRSHRFVEGQSIA